MSLGVRIVSNEIPLVDENRGTIRARLFTEEDLAEHTNDDGLMRSSEGTERSEFILFLVGIAEQLDYWLIEMPGVETSLYQLADFNFMFAHKRRFVPEKAVAPAGLAHGGLGWLHPSRRRRVEHEQMRLLHMLEKTNGRWEKTPHIVISACLDIIYGSPIAVTKHGKYLFLWPAAVYKAWDAELAARNPFKEDDTSIVYKLWMLFNMAEKSPFDVAFVLNRRHRGHQKRAAVFGDEIDAAAGGLIANPTAVFHRRLLSEGWLGKSWQYPRIAALASIDANRQRQVQAFLLLGWELTRRLLHAMTPNMGLTWFVVNRLRRGIDEHRFVFMESSGPSSNFGGFAIGGGLHEWPYVIALKDPVDWSYGYYMTVILHELAHHVAALLVGHNKRWLRLYAKVVVPAALSIGLFSSTLFQEELFKAGDTAIATGGYFQFHWNDAMRTYGNTLGRLLDLNRDEFLQANGLTWPPTLESVEKIAAGGALTELDKMGRIPLPPTDEDFSDELVVDRDVRATLPRYEEEEDEEEEDETDEDGGGGQKRLRQQEEKEEEEDDTDSASSSSQQQPAKRPRLEACAACFAPHPLFVCGHCNAAAYCNVICQATDALLHESLYH